MRPIWIASVLVLGALLAPTALAQRNYAVEGAEVEKRTEALMDRIDWKPSLEEARAQAAESKKLVFWLQIVGDLDGGL